MWLLPPGSCEAVSLMLVPVAVEIPGRIRWLLLVTLLIEPRPRAPPLKGIMLAWIIVEEYVVVVDLVVPEVLIVLGARRMGKFTSEGATRTPGNLAAAWPLLFRFRWMSIGVG